MFTKIAVGTAHSKLILVGEHAVVYGKPAIAIPFPLKVKAGVEESYGDIILNSTLYTGSINDIPLKMKGISACVKEILNYLKKPYKNIKISIDSDIPIGRGLGSSAATATAIVRSLFSYYGQQPSQKELFSFVEVSEAYAHGRPSGIDMNAVWSDYPIWFKKGECAVKLSTCSSLYFAVADTGRVGDTLFAVEGVRKKYDYEPEKVKKSLDEIEKITEGARDALISGNSDLLGELMNRNQKELIFLGVSDAGINELVRAARNTGALGAKLTGGGLGGCIIALAASLQQAKEISEGLLKAGASESWYFSNEGTIGNSKEGGK
jgi:mevalonate kinase